MDPATILAALADLAPAGRERVYDVTGGRSILWLPDPDRPPRTRGAERLAAIDALHQDQRVLRRGWIFLLGAADIDGENRKVCAPLLSEPVRMRRTLGGYTVASAGDLEVTPLISDPDLAADLELKAGDPGDWLDQHQSVNEWIHAAVRAVGLPIDRILRRPPSRNRMSGDAKDGYRLVAVKRAGIYVSQDLSSGSMRGTLRVWSARPGLAETALAFVYGTDAGNGEGDGRPRDRGDHEVLSPLPLDAAQTEVVRRARSDRVTVVSGPPGSGKSHAVVAAALDVVDRGGSVLLTTQSRHAADVLGRLLERYPGPTPVLFGDAEHRDRIATELARGMGAGVGAETLRRDQQAVAVASARVGELSASIAAALETEQRAAEFSAWEPLMAALRADVPGAFVDGPGLATAELIATQLAEQAARRGHGVEGRWRHYWQSIRRRWCLRRLYRALKADPTVPLDRLRAAISAGRSTQAVARLAAGNGTDLAASWQAWHQAEADLAVTVGVGMRHRAVSAARWHRSARRSAAALAGALRAGRNRRRQLLAGMDGDALVRGLPLWVGTASDADDLLPPVPGLFDLVILDEASHLDQVRAAPVLARARRALIVGDPRQLRFVSFVADVDVLTTLHRYGLDDRVDVRRISAFDLATGAAPVTWLDQHYRSAPHLIGFSARRFYGDQLAVVTRHPANESLDVIDVVKVDVHADRGDGVNRAEVEAAVRVVRDLGARGAVGIGVITPFRAQADALESALMEAFSLEELERLALRVGTVHSFQGSEAATVVASLALTDGEPPSRRRFVADPQLFNVMVTRARERMVVVTSLTSPAGVVGDYLAFAGGSPVAPSTAGRSEDAWTDALARGLRRAGLTVRCDYPVGKWSVDLAVGEGAAAVGLCCRVHPDGIASHLDRQRTLARAGWRLVDAFASRWSGDPVRATVALTAGLFATGTPPLSSTTSEPG